MRREALYGKQHETTFADAALSYIEGQEDRKKRVCSPSSLRTLIERYGKRTLASFSPGEVQDIAAKMFQNGGPAYRNRHGIAPFMAVYNHAVKRKLVAPMVVERFKEPTPVTRSVDRSWIESVRAHMPDPHVRAMVRLWFETGMRIGTALQLTKSMLNPDQCTIPVPGMFLKNGEPHEFILSRSMMDELLALPPQKTGRRDRTRLFGFRYDTGVRKHLKRACALAGVPYVTPHESGRHSYATTMIVDEQIDPVTVAELGGWKDVSSLMKRYPHARKAKLRSVVERVHGGTKPKAVK